VNDFALKFLVTLLVSLSPRTEPPIASFLPSSEIARPAGTASQGLEQSSEEILEPGVRRGDGLFDKREFITIEGIGEISDIDFGRIDGDDEEYLILAGHKGFGLVDAWNGDVGRVVTFASTSSLGGMYQRVLIVDTNGDGLFEFARLAANWLGRTSVHGADGKTLWAYPPEGSPAVSFTTCADVSGDGRLEFLMTFNAKDEIHLIDHEGQLVWSQHWAKGIFEPPVFLEVNGDGFLDIVGIDGDALWARNGDGGLLFRTKLPGGGFVNALALVEDYGAPGKDWLLVGHYLDGSQRYYLAPLNAQSVEHEIDRQHVDPYIDTAVVRLEEVTYHAKIEPILRQAPVGGYQATRLRLRLFDESRNCVYEEVLAPPAGDKVAGDGALAALVGEGPNPPKLLVAYGNRVWLYSKANENGR
jgi:hypothetical protein